MKPLVLLDVDGVLLDSLGPHLKICEDKRREYGLQLTIPTQDQFRRMVRGGVKISPMYHLFLAVGFPRELALKADDEYQRIFATNYAPRPFPGINEVLEELYFAGVTLGLVTSNVEANIVKPLASSMAFFRQDCVLTKDPSSEFSKQDAIELAVARCKTEKGRTTYVGDQPGDFRAAAAAGVHFLGASYGWGISGDEVEFESVTSPAGIGRHFRD
jgi:phosphoglycolate phosphatase-like HAD superfamily hydrolase